MQGNEALLRGFALREEVKNLRTDRRIKEEQRLQMMEANKKMATSIRSKSAIWRDPEVAASYLEGGYDATKLGTFMKEQFAPPDPWNVMQANLARDVMKTSGELSNLSPDDIKSGAGATLQNKYFVNMKLLNRDVSYQDAVGNHITPLLDTMVPSAAKAINELALRETEKAIGALAEDDPLRDLEMVKNAAHIQKKLFQEQAGMGPSGRIEYGNALRWLKTTLASRDAEDTIKEALDNKSIKYTNVKGQEEYQDISTSPAFYETLKYIIHEGSLEKMIMRGKLLDPDSLNVLKEELAARKARSKEIPVDDLDFFGKVFGEEPPPSAVERLKSSRSLGKRAIGVAVEVAGELPKLGAETLGRAAKRVVKGSYERRLREAQEEEREEEEYRKRLRAGR